MLSLVLSNLEVRCVYVSELGLLLLRSLSEFAFEEVQQAAVLHVAGLFQLQPEPPEGTLAAV